jgi:hypothetical protein
LSILSRIQFLHLFYFSKPDADRPLYRTVYRQRFRKIVEVGISDAQRAMRLIQVAGRNFPLSQVRYVGLDWFESRPSGAEGGMTLKAAHRLLRRSGARIQLLPGDPLESLARNANDLGQVDVLLFSAGMEPAERPWLWYYLPRILHPRSQVYVERQTADGKTSLVLLDRREIERRAKSSRARRAA